MVVLVDWRASAEVFVLETLAEAQAFKTSGRCEQNQDAMIRSRGTQLACTSLAIAQFRIRLERLLVLWLQNLFAWLHVVS